MRKAKLTQLLTDGFNKEAHQAGYSNILLNLERFQLVAEKKQEFIVVPTLIKELKNIVNS